MEGNVFELLRRLMSRGFIFHHLASAEGDLAVIVGSFGWGQYCDRLHLWSETEACAAREPADSTDVVWSYDGTAADTIQALLELPAPGSPGAPVLSRRSPFGLWLPGRP